MPPGLKNSLYAVGIRPDPNLLKRMQRRADAPDVVEAVDVSEFSTPALRSWLEGTELVRRNEILDVWWPGDRVAVRMSRQVLLDRLDDWWHPAQDDLVITAGGDRLVLDHEEIAYVWLAG